MDIKEIDNAVHEVVKSCIEHRIIDNEIVDKAITFFNKFYNLNEHSIRREDVEKLSNIDFSLKLDFLLWKTSNPEGEKEIKQFYRTTPFEFFKNLLKNMDVMHYNILREIILPALDKEKYKNILDYGGGSGYCAILLNKLGYKVSFAEISKISLEWMKYITKELNMDIEVIDLCESEITNNYDLIVVKDVLEHVFDPKSLIDNLKKNSKQLLLMPEKMDKNEDYLPMHFPYELKEM